MKTRLLLAAVVLVLPGLFSSASAQDHGPPAGGSDKNLRDSTSDVKGRSNEIERVKRDLEKPETPETPETPTHPSFSEIKEDFERIRIINSDVLQVNAPSGAPSFERISEAAAEIKKRAIRLRSNLFALKSPKQSKETGPGTEDHELKSLLAVLDEAITKFTQSPIFQNTKVANAEDSKKAQTELERIMKLSGQITLEADRLKKTNSPPN